MMDDTPPVIPADVAQLLVALIEKLGLLKRDIEQQHDGARYEARVARVGQKLSALAERIALEDEALAKALHTAWALPARSLAFRNAAHRRPQPKGPDGE